MSGIWVGASYVLGRDVLVTEPYPHVCGSTVTGLMTGRQVYLSRRECAACLIRAGTAAPAAVPAIDIQALAAGERDDTEPHT